MIDFPNCVSSNVLRLRETQGSWCQKAGSALLTYLLTSRFISNNPEFCLLKPGNCRKYLQFIFTLDTLKNTILSPHIAHIAEMLSVPNKFCLVFLYFHFSTNGFFCFVFEMNLDLTLLI